jgi:hypothetical protein
MLNAIAGCDLPTANVQTHLSPAFATSRVTCAGGAFSQAAALAVVNPPQSVPSDTAADAQGATAIAASANPFRIVFIVALLLRTTLRALRAIPLTCDKDAL